MSSFPDYDTPFRMRTQLFRPPHTPTSTSSSYYQSPDTETARKRMRRESPDVRTLAWDPMSSTELESSSLLINTDYILSHGGVNLRQLDLDEIKEKSIEELDYRPNRYRQNSSITEEVVSAPTAEIGGTGTRKRSRSSVTEMTARSLPTPSATTTPGWGRAVFSVVGKVWDFCWSNAFRGFSAGGGKTYQVATPKNDATASRTSLRSRSDITPVPGQYPNEEMDAENEQDKEAWVLVPESRPLQESPTQSPSPASFSRKIPRRMIACRPPTRRSLVNTQRPVLKRPTLTATTNIADPPLSPTNRPSTPIRPLSSPGKPSTSRSPVSREAQRLAAQVRRRERQEEASFQKMNDQLKALIREGREALGSRVEVDEMDFDD